MKDINFFDVYISKRTYKLRAKLFLLIFGFIMVILLVGYGISNQSKIKELQIISNELELTINDLEYLKKVNNAKEEKIELNRFKKEVETIKKVNSTLHDKEFIKEDFIKSIFSKMPKDMFLTSIIISDMEIKISGVSMDKLYIAEFGKGIESIERIEEVFISDVLQEEEGYRFNITCFLKGGPMDDE
ncbi:PilN domain-containing protein [Wansuia hejianensis]|uniref:PilN domain-containing protein n=1 Tax=Wansuia hejianensis TaxID=2763667 RepID=A0A926EYA2_9FIRM|nr:PilN domain-containing protein [Wansuia hejianensis]MBC8590588.1 PilN domain-containing protein [Wansuia hejianensis]